MVETIMSGGLKSRDGKSKMGGKYTTSTEGVRSVQISANVHC